MKLKILAALVALMGAVMLSPTGASASPLAPSSGTALTHALEDQALTESVQYRRGYGRRHYRPARHYRPVRYYRPARCVVRSRTYVNRYGYVVRRPVRVCYR